MTNATEPALEDVILEILDSRFRDVHTCLPGKVVKYDRTKQTADIQLQIKHAHETEEGSIDLQSYPVLPNVPVAAARGGGFFVHFPMAPGDFVLVVFSEAAIDQWRAKGQETAPGDLRRHSLTGAVALPCLYPRTRPLAEENVPEETLVVGREGGGTIHFTADGELLLGSGSASDFVALSSKVDGIFTLLDGVFRSTTTPTPGGGAALKAAYLAAFSLPPDSVAAEKVKAE